MNDEGDQDALRTQAVERLKKQRDFKADLLAYGLINGLVIAIWAMTSRGFFWPMFSLFGWGIGVVFHAWDAYSRPPSEDRIRREMDHISGGHQ